MALWDASAGDAAVKTVERTALGQVQRLARGLVSKIGNVDQDDIPELPGGRTHGTARPDVASPNNCDLRTFHFGSLRMCPRE